MALETLTVLASAMIWFFASLVTTRNLRIAAYIGVSLGVWSLIMLSVVSGGQEFGSTNPALAILGFVGIVGINWYFLKSPKKVIINFVVAIVLTIVLGVALIGVIIVGLGGLT